MIPQKNGNTTGFSGGPWARQKKNDGPKEKKGLAPTKGKGKRGGLFAKATTTGKKERRKGGKKTPLGAERKQESRKKEGNPSGEGDGGGLSGGGEG